MALATLIGSVGEWDYFIDQVSVARFDAARISQRSSCQEHLGMFGNAAEAKKRCVLVMRRQKLTERIERRLEKLAKRVSTQYSWSAVVGMIASIGAGLLVNVSDEDMIECSKRLIALLERDGEKELREMLREVPRKLPQRETRYAGTKEEAL